MSDPENGHPLIFPDISCFSIYLRIFLLFGLRYMYLYVPGTEIHVGIRSRRREIRGDRRKDLIQIHNLVVNHIPAQYHSALVNTWRELKVELVLSECINIRAAVLVARKWEARTPFRS